MTLIADLMAIGFTEYESKIYLELLRDSPATGYQLSKRAGVPRSMVYEALGRLHTRGAVLETHEERATLYNPLPPEVLLDNHEHEQQRLMAGLREGLHRVSASHDEDHLWSISGRRPVLSYAHQMVNQAQSELMLVLSDVDLDALRADIVKAAERGVTVKTLLTGNGELEHGEVARHPPLESKIQQLTDLSMVIADNHEALIISAGVETTATITRNPNLVLIARQFVWMELFTQRIYARLDGDLLERLNPEDREIFESLPGRDKEER